MLPRGNNTADRLVSFFKLSNTIPETKRRVFLSVQLLAIAMLITSTILLPLLGFDWFVLFANIIMIAFLTVMTLLLWRRRERQELILFLVFIGSAAWLFMVMLHDVLQVPPGTSQTLLQIVSPWLIWIFLIYMVCFLTFRASTALRLSISLSVMAVLILLYTMARIFPIKPSVLYNFIELCLANILVLALAFPLAHAQEHIAYTDFLTALPNRSQGYDMLVGEIERARRYGHAFALILFDIDHFKKVNDTCGHPCGDRILQEISAFARAHIRRTDLLCRWGGEEFLLIMPHTDLASARLKADHLRQQFKNRPFHRTIRLTASFGITVYLPFDSPNSLLERADKALYLAKRNGRNCVQVE